MHQMINVDLPRSSEAERCKHEIVTIVSRNSHKGAAFTAARDANNVQLGMRYSRGGGSNWVVSGGVRVRKARASWCMQHKYHVSDGDESLSPQFSLVHNLLPVSSRASSRSHPEPLLVLIRNLFSFSSETSSHTHPKPFLALTQNFFSVSSRTSFPQASVNIFYSKNEDSLTLTLSSPPLSAPHKKAKGTRRGTDRALRPHLLLRNSAILNSTIQGLPA